MEIEVGFSLGSNIGDSVGMIEKAIDLLDAGDGLTITKRASFYETPPWGVENQNWFVNSAATGVTSLKPHELLKLCKSIEQQLGRVPGERWGPRLIDIDIIYYGSEEIISDDLAIPHVQAKKRAFVLLPLSEIAPELQIDGYNILYLLDKISSDAEKIKKMKK